MMKKIILSIVLFAMLFSLSACGGGEVSLSSGTTAGGTGSLSDVSDGTDKVTDSQSSQGGLVTMPPSYQGGTSDTVTDPEKLLKSGEYLVGLTDQKNNRLIVCDLSVKNWSGDKAVRWQYKGVSAAGIKFRNCDYWGGEVVVYCGGTKAGIISYSTRKLLLETNEAPGNSHSVEILPNGVLVVVGSTSNTTKVFGAGKTTPSFSLTFKSGHGALWDPKYQVLWLEGDNLLQAYKVTGTAENPALEAVKGMTYHPNTSLHDMAPVYGNPDALLLTGANGVVYFDKTTGKASHNYPAGGFLKTQTYVPGVGNYPGDQVYVFTTIRDDTLTYKEWGSDQVAIFVSTGNGRGKVLYRKAPKDAYYKARAWISDYQ